MRYTTRQVAKILGISQDRLRKLAISRKVGKRMFGVWTFNEKDIDNLKIRINGRPPIKS